MRYEAYLSGQSLAPWWATSGWSLGPQVQWACDSCLKNGRALEADASKQLFCDFPPYLAYFDVRLQCRDCASSFVFRGSEQRHWYEVLGFWVHSRPKQCLDCRKERRKRREQSTRLQQAIETLDSNDPEGLAFVARLLLDAGSERKALMYLRRAKNKARTTEQRAALVQWMERFDA